jgi:hypothetical protein
VLDTVTRAETAARTVLDVAIPKAKVRLRTAIVLAAILAMRFMWSPF